MSRLLALALLVLLSLWLPGRTEQAASAVAAALGGLAAPANGVDMDDRVLYYDIEGSTGPELGSSMRARGPRQVRGRFVAYTDVRLRWDVRWEPAGGECAITETRVRGTVEMQLPRWSPPAGAAPDLTHRWRSFAAALLAHERGHRDLGHEHARALHRALATLRTPSCASMHAAADAVAADLDRRFSQRSKEYDRRTEHGRSQGAHWPW